MEGFTWNLEKNETLRKERGVSFEKLVQTIESGGLIADQENPNRPGQRRLIIYHDSYVWVIPYVVDSQRMKVLKTAYPNRKLYKRYCQ